LTESVEPERDAVAMMVSGPDSIVYGVVPPEIVAVPLSLGARVNADGFEENPCGGFVVSSSFLQPFTPMTSIVARATTGTPCSNSLALIKLLQISEWILSAGPNRTVLGK
jgi:hypothetical protein